MGGEIMAASGEEQGGARGELHRVGEGIGHVKATLRDFAAKGEELAGIMTSVATIISEMSAYVGKIEDVGSEIELIAINASIKAAHTGEEGAALGVLASAIQGLSVEARKQTDEVSRILREVAKSSNILQDNATVYYDTSQVESMVGNMDGFLEQIRDMDRRGTRMFSEIGEKSAQLGEDVGDLASGVRFHVEVAERLDAVRTSLAELRQLARKIEPADQDVRRPERLRELFGRYTMEAERDVHESVFGGAARREPVEERKRPAPDEHGFGDNVELF
jgi:methyl-accepting chemotaxis protein